jgi:retinol dehydrogenase-12
MQNAEGKVCVITGGTGGLGMAVAERLAAHTGRLVLIGRDRRKGEMALLRLKRRAPWLAVEIRYADLSRLDNVRELAARLRAALPRIDLLINNAGAVYSSREVTPDGIERTFALNHMAHFVLTELLRERLAASAPARVINVTSMLHRLVTLDFDDLQGERHYGGWLAYSRSKLCNILFTRELSRRLGGTGVTANCLNPGFLRTGFGDNNGKAFQIGFGILKSLFGLPPKWAAAAVESVATSPELEAVTGAYFGMIWKATPSRAALNDDAASRLWQVSERLAGIARCASL